MSRSIKKICGFAILMSFLFHLLLPCAAVFAEEESVTILFTHDLHDHLLPYTVYKEGKIQTLGGFARLQSAIKAERERDPDLLLVDGGDFSMGTLFQTIFTSHAPQLRIMGHMGYDVTTFGNHEFDYRASGLAGSLRAALESGDPLPQIVASNLAFPSGKESGLTPSLRELQEALSFYGVKEYLILERGNLKIGVFALMGKDA
ncbi:MAG: bifunctional metallophosphatase/5'-nucleotidase, partial [Firmicutes bacterium]|nr:bifunctional metallophosphatase/5'-nucleotidase [Bacillota bacterium]